MHDHIEHFNAKKYQNHMTNCDYYFQPISKSERVKGCWWACVILISYHFCVTICIKPFHFWFVYSMLVILFCLRIVFFACVMFVIALMSMRFCIAMYEWLLLLRWHFFLIVVCGKLRVFLAWQGEAHNIRYHCPGNTLKWKNNNLLISFVANKALVKYPTPC